MQAGQFGQAERACQQALANAAPHPERFFYALGHIYMARRELGKATKALRDAVVAAPGYVEALHTLSFVLKERGDVEGALTALVQAAGVPGAGVEVHFNLAVLRRERGENRLAIDSFRRVLSIDPRLSAAWQGMGLACRALNEIDAALDALRRAVECDPRNASAYLALGTILLDHEKPGADEALAHAAALDERSVDIAERYARALARVGRFDDACREHERSRRLAPHSGACILSHARTLFEIGQTAAADDLCRRVIDSPQADSNERAAAHHELADRALLRGDIAAARILLDTALTLAPAADEIRLRRAMMQLSLGEFDPGWREFEARFGNAVESGGSIRAQPFPQPRWRGEDLRDRTILVWGEQGIGDDIVAASMLPDLAARAGRVFVHTDTRLEPLFRRSLPANVSFFPRVLPVQRELLSDEIDCQTPLGSLGEFLRPSWQSFGSPRAFLRADPLMVEKFRQRYAALPGRKIGISWRSGNLVNGRVKSTDLVTCTPILRTPGVTFVNLQYGDCRSDLDRAREQLGVRIHHDESVDQLRDMDSFAAQVASLDLVLSVSNAVAHTAGALGLPTWVLLAVDPLWLWFRERADSPWYPQVRLFRQTRAADWREPVARAAVALEAWSKADGRG